MTPGIIVVATVVVSRFAGAAEWPQFRGPNSSGIGDGKPPVEFGPSQNVLWKTAVVAGLSGRLTASGFNIDGRRPCIGNMTGSVRSSFSEATLGRTSG